MSKEIVLFCALPGSGKSFHAKRMLVEDGVYIDDICLHPNLDILKQAIKDNKKQIIITDPFLCRERERVAAAKQLVRLAPDYVVKWIFFENNPEKCLNNIKNRVGEKAKVKELIKQLSKEYIIPEGIIPVIIWQKPRNHI